MSGVMSARASAPGKINLVLNVGHSDERGYHPLLSVFDTVSQRETVCVRLTEDLQRPPVSVSTRVGIGAANDAQVQAAMNGMEAADNLAAKAVLKLARATESSLGKRLLDGELALAVEIFKTIPMAGGMAGGSADAAAALVAANEALGTHLSTTELLVLARELGADVPACLVGRVSVATGYGDRIVTALDVPPHHWVLVFAHQSLSTPEVFKAFDAAGHGRAELSTNLTDSQLQMLRNGSLGLLLENDLQVVAARRPDLAATFSRLRQLEVPAILSGSGPTIAVLAADADEARQLAGTIATWESVAGTAIARSPGAPARLERSSSN